MKILTLITALTFSVSAFAEEGYTIKGAGANKCFQYLDAPLDSTLDTMYMSWAQGYMSAIFYVGQMPKTQEQLESDYLRRNINLYCKEYPSKNFYDAVSFHVRIVNNEGN